MSQETVVEVITKVLVDAEFRSQLFAEPGAALSGYDLTEEERASLSALQEDAFDAFASEVEERVSKLMPIPIPMPVEQMGMDPDLVTLEVSRTVQAELESLDLTELLGR